MEHIPLDQNSDFSVNQFLKNIYLLTGMTTTLYNSHKQWITSYPLRNCGYCGILRTNTEYHLRCRSNDAEAFDLCTKQERMIVYRCYMGLYEIMLPIYKQNIICGYLILGQAMEDSEKARQECFELLRAAHPDTDTDILWDAIKDTNAISKEKLAAVTQMAQIYAEYASDNDLIKTEFNSLATLVSNYIKNHLTEKITNAELCHIFFCDRKKLTAEFRKAHGVTIVEYTNNLRLRMAREMMQKDPNLSISYISSASGFSYQSYFCTLFYKKYGMSPTEMQRLYKEEMKRKEK